MSNEEVERQTCVSCGSQVHNMSLDILVAVTCYDETGDITKTMEEVSRMDKDIVAPDDQYLVICSLCARHKFADIYNRFIADLQGEMS